MKLFPLQAFEPQKTPTLVYLTGTLVMAPVYILWGVGAYLAIKLLEGNILLGAFLVPWSILVVLSSAAVHNKGHMRFSISASCAFLVIGLALMGVLRF